MMKMMSHTGRSRLWRPRAAVLLLALISAKLFVLLVSDGQLASAQTPPPDPIARAWGNNSFGQLGDDSTAPRSRQVPVLGVGGTGSLGNATSMEGGQNHSLAVKCDGTVYAWGHNDVGQLGNDTSGSGTDSDTPVQVQDPSDPTGFLTGVIDVAAGSKHSLALKSDGTVWA